ncbi:UV damage endonuclease UvsE [bacterium]|nr:UV damage endonuclease UvsE [bacterium]MDB4128445.1 UV damage endonuclease UvsE [bacterium]MDC1257156.1 UV damage endonuclease UvsE [bacterium]
MFNPNIQRVGFACKYMHPDQTQKPKILKEIQGQYSERSTTITWLDRQTPDVAEEKLWDCLVTNARNARRLIEYVGNLPEQQRMVRLGSNMMPAYTHPNWKHFYARNDVRDVAEREWSKTGEVAASLDVRLSMHPGQFTVLASDNPDIVERSLEEFEYHADIIRWMGYGKTWQDFKCNVHISGRQGPAGIKAALKRLSPEARNTITIENDENKWGLADSLELENDVALVIDIHHHLCREGEYINANDDRIKRVIDSWRGVRPAMHYSQSREDILLEHGTDVRPDFVELYETGYKKGKLRAHSDFMWNTAVNEWAGTFRKDFDIMVEAKAKNLASIPFEEMTR